MALKLTSKNPVRFSWADDSMEALFVLKPTDSEEELVEKMQRIINFVTERRRPELPERTPGLALEMAQMTHPAPVGNGWAVQPEIPARLQNEVEMIPPEERDA